MSRIMILLVLQSGLLAGVQAQPDSGKLAGRRLKHPTDSLSLLGSFRHGQLHGRFRYFFMVTDNRSGLTDYYANALGGRIKFETAPYRKFQLGVAGSFAFNIASTDLTQPDPKTNQWNRYEIGLFDIEDPANKTDITRLDELYVKYSWKHSQVVFGKQAINSPFINAQDGRMAPTQAGGVYAMINEIKNLSIGLGFLNRMSPRSTTKWFSVGESVGLYPQGVNADGTKSGYRDNLESKGIGLIDGRYTLSPDFSVLVHDMLVENIFNSVMVELDGRVVLKDNSKIIGGLQFIRQDALASGGNNDAAKAYFQKGGKSASYGLKLGWENGRWATSANYNRILPWGRYLMPREWGRDPFFTFLPRERNEGLGDVHAYVLKARYRIPAVRVSTEAGVGYFQLPPVTEYALNKYGVPSYTQVNIDVRHELDGAWKGLEIHILFVHKGQKGNNFGNDKYIINKVDMCSWNLVLNYQF